MIYHITYSNWAIQTYDLSYIHWNTACVTQATHSYNLNLPALSLQCYECTNSPGFTGVSKCDSDDVTKRTCDGLADRCMTVTYNFTLLTSQIVVTKNCSTSLACDPDFQFNCKYLVARFLYLPVVVYI